MSVLASAAATAVALFLAGVLRALSTLNAFLKSGFEVVLVGMGAAAATYLVGLAVGDVVGQPAAAPTVPKNSLAAREGVPTPGDLSRGHGTAAAGPPSSKEAVIFARLLESLRIWPLPSPGADGLARERDFISRRRHAVRSCSFGIGRSVPWSIARTKKTPIAPTTIAGGICRARRRNSSRP
jgi:hypothetical protein